MEQKEVKNLLSEISRGNREALSQIFTEYYVYLYNYGLKLISSKDEELVKDCIQDIFLSLWSKRERLIHVKSIKPYLFSALRLRIFKQLEKKTISLKRDQNYYDESFKDYLNIEELIIHFETNNERDEKLKKAIKSLSKRKREVMYLKFYDGLSNEEISEIMGINIQSVYNLVSQTIEILKDFLN